MKSHKRQEYTTRLALLASAYFCALLGALNEGRVPRPDAGRLDDVSSWWSTDSQHEIDIVGTQNIKAITCVGSVKWQTQPMGWAELKALRESAAVLGVGENSLHILVGRGGLDPKLTSTPNVRGVSAAQLYQCS